MMEPGRAPPPANIKSSYAKAILHIQQTSYSCGPCSLLNALSAKGVYGFTEDELIRVCDAREGVGTGNDRLAEAAGEVGLEVVAAGAGNTLADLGGHLEAACLVIVNYIDAFDGAGHYAVVVEADEEALYLRDSSLGLLRVKRAHFPDWWRSESDETGGGEGWLLAVR